MERDEEDSHGCLLRDGCPQYHFPAPALDLDRVAVSDAVHLSVGRMDVQARFGVSLIQCGVARHRAAMPMFEDAPGRKDERILIVCLFHYRDVIQWDEFAASTWERFLKEGRCTGVIQ